MFSVYVDLPVLDISVNEMIFSHSPLPMGGDMFQDPQWMSETADTTKPYIAEHMEKLSVKFSMSELKIIYHQLVQEIHQKKIPGRGWPDISPCGFSLSK